MIRASLVRLDPESSSTRQAGKESAARIAKKAKTISSSRSVKPFLTEGVLRDGGRGMSESPVG